LSFCKYALLWREICLTFFFRPSPASRELSPFPSVPFFPVSPSTTISPFVVVLNSLFFGAITRTTSLPARPPSLKPPGLLDVLGRSYYVPGRCPPSLKGLLFRLQPTSLLSSEQYIPRPLEVLSSTLFHLATGSPFGRNSVKAIFHVRWPLLRPYRLSLVGAWCCLGLLGPF